MKIAEIRSRIAELVGVRQTAADELTRIRARIAAAGEEIEALNVPALCRADLEELTRKDVEFMRENIAKTTGIRDIIRQRATSAVPISVAVRGDGPSEQYDLLREPKNTSDVLYLLFTPDQIMTALRPVFDAVDWPSPGPRLSVRVAKRRALEVEREQLTALEAELVATIDAVAAPRELAAPVQAMNSNPSLGGNLDPDLVWTSGGWKWRSEVEK